MKLRATTLQRYQNGGEWYAQFRLEIDWNDGAGLLPVLIKGVEESEWEVLRRILDVGCYEGHIEFEHIDKRGT